MPKAYDWSRNHFTSEKQRGCTHKKYTFRDIEDARKMAETIADGGLFRHKMTAYHCRYGNHYHIGNRRKMEVQTLCVRCYGYIYKEGVMYCKNCE